LLFAGAIIELPNRSSEDDLYSFLVSDLEAVIGLDTPPSEVLFWHTHPGGNIGPSKYDLDRRLEGFQYMVVALTPEGPVPARY
jgi:proteasome lid subunit RPN8/RPN11